MNMSLAGYTMEVLYHHHSNLKNEHATCHQQASKK